MKKISRFVTIAVLLVSPLCNATSPVRQSEALITENVSLKHSGSESTLSDAEKSLAKDWMLQESDWLKYKNLMLGPRGVWSPGLDPITALGVSEEDPVERARYAEIWMKVETRRAELEIAFEVERQRVAKKQFSKKLAVNNKSWIDSWEKKRVEINEQVALFIDGQCKGECQSLFNVSPAM